MCVGGGQRGQHQGVFTCQGQGQYCRALIRLEGGPCAAVLLPRHRQGACLWAHTHPTRTSFWLLVSGQNLSSCSSTGSASLGSFSTNCGCGAAARVRGEGGTGGVQQGKGKGEAQTQTLASRPQACVHMPHHTNTTPHHNQMYDTCMRKPAPPAAAWQAGPTSSSAPAATPTTVGDRELCRPARRPFPFLPFRPPLPSPA